MFEVLSKYWWVPIVRGVLAIIFGILTFMYPGVTLASLILLFAIWAIIDGIAAVIGAFNMQKAHGSWILSLIGGLLGIGIGVATFFMPGITAMALIFYIAAWSIVRGIFDIATGIKFRHILKHEWLLMLAGAASILFGLMVIWHPGAGALAILWLIGTYAILFGIIMIVWGFRLYGLKKELGHKV